MSALINFEFCKVLKNRGNLAFSLLLPLIVCILPLLALFLDSNYSTIDPEVLSYVKSMLGPVTAKTASQFIIVNISFFMFVFLALVIPISLTLTEFIDEKKSKSIEYVLAEPIKPIQYLGAKLITALLVTWLIIAGYAGLYAVLVGLSVDRVVFDHIIDWRNIVILFMICPMLSCMSVSVSFWIAGKIREIKIVYALTGAMSFPVHIAMIGYLMSKNQFGISEYLLFMGMVALLTAGLFWYAAKQFRKESVIIDWKY